LFVNLSFFAILFGKHRNLIIKSVPAVTEFASRKLACKPCNQQQTMVDMVYYSSGSLKQLDNASQRERSAANVSLGSTFWLWYYSFHPHCMARIRCFRLFNHDTMHPNHARYGLVTE